MGQIDHRIIAFLFVLQSIGAFAQYNIGFEETPSITINDGANLRLATVGGFSNPQFSEIDLNGDAFLDLFIFDRGKDTWRTFVYNSSTDQYDYHPIYESYFPDNLSELVLLRDFNCDGHVDIFTYHSGGFRVFQNTGQTPLNFTLVTDALQSDYGSVTTSAFVLPGDVPAIVDVDFDGDLDVLTFGNGDSENSIVWHKNQSMELYGSCDSLEFEVNTECWGGFQEPSNGSNLEAISCRGPISPPSNHLQASRHHPGSTILLTDVSGNSVLDIAIGDIQTKTLVYASNIGDASSAEIDVSTQTTSFPSASDPVDMQFMMAAYELDVDKNGLMDLVVTTNNNIDSSCNSDQIWLYKNTASTGANYTLSSKVFLSDEMVDLGSGAVPNMHDVDGDGLMDMLICVDFIRTPAAYKRSRLHYYRNTGTSTNPVFTLENDDFAELSNFGFQAAHPCFGDIDGDGDDDMIIGVASGALHYFRNDPVGNTSTFSLVGPNYMGINSIGQYAAPHLGDINGDELLDLVVGEQVGTMTYFENSGTSSAAQFTSTPTIEKFGKIDVSYYCCGGFAAPVLKNDGVFGTGNYLFVGSSEKRIIVYEVPANLNDSFHIVDSILILADRITPVFYDFKNDGIEDLLVGTGEGGLKYFERDGNYPVGIEGNKDVSKSIEVRIVPNPGDELVTIDTKAQGRYRVFNSIGQVIDRGKVDGNNALRLKTSEWQSGVYYFHFENSTNLEVLPFIVLH